MFGYYLNLALRSLRRNIVLTVLMIVAIGVGIGASMTMLTMLRAASGDPIPQKSGELFIPQLDNFGPRPGAPPQTRDRLPPDLTYIDATALLRAHAAPRQAAMYPVSLSITPPDPTGHPVQAYGRATSSDFFPMFDVPFKYGGPWGRTEDESHAPVVVLARALNDELFGGTDSVGRNLTIGGKSYRVIGVLADWHLSPRFYDLGFAAFSSEDQLFLPFTRAIDQHMQTDGNFNCDRLGAGKGWDGILHSNCIWISMWVELPTAQDVARYRTFLHDYAAEQQQTGRFHWPPRIALRNVMQWLHYNHIVPASIDAFTIVSFTLLLVCLLNATGLMLAKFMARNSAICVRRALGASRLAIFAQFIVEAGLIGLAGGLLGIALAKLGLLGCRAVLWHDFAVLTWLRGSDVLIAFALALASTLIAGLYPAWRAMQVQPASHLKTL